MTALSIDTDEIPAYFGEAYVEINGNVPYFTDSELSTTSYEYYSELDSLGRCGVCVANIGTDFMPTENRGEIGNIKPTGWHTVKYSDIIEGNYLYNRCHLIGFQLAGEIEGGRRTALDIDGNILPNNVQTEQGTMRGMTQSEYNAITHFNNTDLDFDK